jgi:hypothetical protein
MRISRRVPGLHAPGPLCRARARRPRARRPRRACSSAARLERSSLNSGSAASFTTSSVDSLWAPPRPRPGPRPPSAARRRSAKSLRDQGRRPRVEVQRAAAEALAACSHPPAKPPHLMRCCRASSACASAPCAHRDARSRAPPAPATSRPPMSAGPPPSLRTPTSAPHESGMGRPSAAASSSASVRTWASSCSSVSRTDSGAASLGVPCSGGGGSSQGWAEQAASGVLESLPFSSSGQSRERRACERRWPLTLSAAARLPAAPQERGALLGRAVVRQRQVGDDVEAEQVARALGVGVGGEGERISAARLAMRCRGQRSGRRCSRPCEPARAAHLAVAGRHLLRPQQLQ